MSYTQGILKLGRFGISGIIATATNISCLYLLTDVLGFWYILSTIISFFIAFSVSFTLQKYWTFKDTAHRKITRQAPLFLALTSFNLILNTALMYASVEYLGIHYLIAQFVISALIACQSYFLYGKVIFKRAKTESGTGGIRTLEAR